MTDINQSDALKKSQKAWEAVDLAELQKIVAEIQQQQPSPTDQSSVFWGYVLRLRKSKLFSAIVATMKLVTALKKATVDPVDALMTMAALKTAVEAIRDGLFKKLAPLELLIFLFLEVRREQNEGGISEENLKQQIISVYLSGDDVLAFLPTAIGIDNNTLAAAKLSMDTPNMFSTTIQQLRSSGVIKYEANTNSYTIS